MDIDQMSYVPPGTQPAAMYELYKQSVDFLKKNDLLTIGGLQFYALKKELVDSKKMTLKQYHDAVLRENGMPVEMLRAILTNQSLKRDFRTNWRFYEK